MTDEATGMSAQAFRGFVQETRQLLVDKHRSDYRLGAALHRIREERLHNRWPRDDQRQPGYDNFGEFCDRELGYSASQANMKASNYIKLQVIRLDENGVTFARCMRLGWSKLNCLLRVASTEENLVAWLNDIEGKGLSEAQLRQRIALAQAALDSNPTGDPSDADGEDDDAPPTTAGYVTYKVMFESQSALDTFTRAVDIVRARFGGDVGMGRVIEMIALQYIATVPSQAEGGAAAEVENLIRMVESAYGLRLGVITPEKRKKPRSRSLSKMQDGAR